MLKNRISFDNATHWIPTRCEDVTRSERCSHESWTENKFSIQTNTKYTYLFCANEKNSANEATEREEERRKKAAQHTRHIVSVQFEWQWNKFNLIRTKRRSEWESECEQRQRRRAAKTSRNADTLISEIIRLLHWFTEQLQQSDKQKCSGSDENQKSGIQCTDLCARRRING